ncbi:putative sporulation protein YyaC [Cytobacillus firmus]|uniref:Putative sporulation protein YyaC n=2 Tax=Cytobacillus TaxID=2675230 RepID=A0A366JS81_CYTFI|nr:MULTISPECIES: spore protease YyaC [Cytobacillus]RBP90656.1 putative sporulation protein YyaC [Cytobacillus firmus]TDX46238.1 putative sporulation protein YyaC [Cytobacillus oceanisediminis]
MWPFSSSKQNKNVVDAASYISIKETTEEAEIEKMVTKLEQIFYSTSREIVILCIGSDRSTGDSLGPLAGKILKEKNIPYPVYGTLQEPVHALNIKKVLKEIKETYDDPFIFGIDACLGDERQIGYILIREGSFIPGNAVNRALPSVGDFHLKAIVNTLDPLSPVHSLNSTRLYMVLKLAEIIAEIISRVAANDNTSRGVIEKMNVP